MSSISPVVARKLATEAERQGCEMLDAPVRGGEMGANNATLSIMV
jgi:2-hydroxy-3-oxopropionate reductase